MAYGSTNWKLVSSVSAPSYALSLLKSTQETANGHTYKVMLFHCIAGVHTLNDLCEEKFFASPEGAWTYYEDTLFNLRKNSAA